MGILLRFVPVLTLIASTVQAQSIVTLGNLPSDAFQIIQGSDGNFYGIASSGGDGMCQNTFRSGPCGSVFEVTPTGVVSTLYSFQPGPNATSSFPYPNGIIQGTDGNFYGTTQFGGTARTSCPSGCGTIFKVTPGGSATTLYAFDQVHGSNPYGNLVEGTDGNFYGVTEYGGTGTNCIGIEDAAGTLTEVGCGTIFKITSQGVLTSLHSFNLNDGATPLLLIQGTDGNFYGTTQLGGAGDYCPSSVPGFLKGCGTVFKITPASAFSTLYEFEGPGTDADPTDLIQAANGSFYVIASGINNVNYGTIFQLTSAGVLTTAVAFNGANGVLPNSLIQGSDGNLYGTTQGVDAFGGVSSQVTGGTLFQLSPATGTLLTLYNFCALGCTQSITIPGTTVIQGKDGNLYGIVNESQFFRYDLISPTAPAISANSGVVNGASFQAGIAAGAWLTINGTNLSTTTDTWANSIVKGALPATLGGVSVSVGGQPAYIEYVSPTQINALAPNIPAGSVVVTVTNPNGTSQAAMAQLSAEQPAFFQWGNYAVATHQNYTYAVKNGTFAGTTTVPAAPGDVIILWGTGFGPTSPAAPTGIETPPTATYNTATVVSVTVGGKSATVYGAALAPGYAGLYQVAIQVPASLANGDYPVIATINGVSSPSATMITVQQ
jgi:uncharacterized protein (TIGR03437 family)